MGYTFKNGVDTVDDEHLYRLEKYRIPDSQQIMKSLYRGTAK